MLYRHAEYMKINIMNKLFQISLFLQVSDLRKCQFTIIDIISGIHKLLLISISTSLDLKRESHRGAETGV